MNSAAGARDPGPAVVTECQEIYDVVTEQRQRGKSVGLVPTMGALHAGHLSLVEAANQQCDVTVVTIFVNPTQFSPQEDFEAYPRSLESDLTALAAYDVDFVFAPANAEMYPPEFTTSVDPPAVSKRWEGECRPGHFAGVATVVLKLLHIVPADVAFFGAKDFQQSLVIRHVVRDLNLAISVHICPTIREPDGLAFSSRNQYLSPPERVQALALSKSLQLANNLIDQGCRETSLITEQMRDLMLAAGVRQIDYVAIADPESLEPLDQVDLPAVVLVAARVGRTRLIDNRTIG